MDGISSSFDYRKGWSINPAAKPGDIDAKAPFIDNGTEKFDPAQYYDKGWMAQEWEKLWTKAWLIACPSSDVREEGDFATFEIGNENIVVVRGDDGQVRAFYNVCPHRGNRLVHTALGSLANGFACSFHSWKFNLDGSLKAITDRETFRPEVVCHNPGMSAVRCEELAGLVFISMNPDAPDLRGWLGPVAAHLESYQIDKMHVVRQVRSEWAANWKVGVDAFYEVYHLHAVHPETQGVMEDYFVQYDLFPNGMSRMCIPFYRPSPRVPDQLGVNEGLKMMMPDAALDPAGFTGTAQEVRAAAQKAKRERAERLGLGYEKLTDAQLTDSFAYGLFPNVQIGCHPEGVFLMRFIPHPEDPERFFYDITILFRPVGAVAEAAGNYDVPAWMGLPEGTDISGRVRPDCVHVPLGQPANLGLVLDQDSELLPVVQKGLRSRGFNGMLFGEQEQRLRHFHVELNRYMAAGAPR